MFMTVSLATMLGKIATGYWGSTAFASFVGWFLGISLAILLRGLSWTAASYLFGVLDAPAGNFPVRAVVATSWAIAYTTIELILFALYSAFCAIVALF